ncbi:MAG: hypothetical protein PHV99_02340 [Candidatus Pacebacteria bacterium]|nr:hypothetical protein [Candidatus Paceibacterota bacterium]
MQLILPKTVPSFSFVNEALPLFFLAGPIGGGDDWHFRMTELLMSHSADCVIVNPTRYKPNHPHYQYRVSGDDDVYTRQTDWERRYMCDAAKASLHGCLIFWLPKESVTNPRSDGEPYARDTRGEIAEWRTHLMYDRSLRVVVGAEEEFPGLSVIRRNFELTMCPAFPIYRTMEEVAGAAVKFAMR